MNEHPFIVSIIIGSLIICAIGISRIDARLSNIDRTFTAILAHIEGKRP